MSIRKATPSKLLLGAADALGLEVGIMLDDGSVDGLMLIVGRLLGFALCVFVGIEVGTSDGCEEG